jgi:DNA-binding transcriptional LysR family regulator
LTAFERIARAGSFSRAARELQIAQPTISARIHALERTVGGALFVRSGRRVTLTDLGASLLPYARRALELLDEGAEAARQAQAGRRGRVTIGVLESLSGAFLGPALSDYCREHPHVEVVVRAGRHEQLMELLYDGIIGMALVAWPCLEALDTSFEALLTMREHVPLTVAAGHPLTAYPALTQRQLIENARPFLLMRWWQTLPQALERLAASMPAVVDVPLDTARHMLLSGAGVGFFTWMQAAEGVASGALVTIPVNDMPQLLRESALVRIKRDIPPAPAAGIFADGIRRRAEQLGLLIAG